MDLKLLPAKKIYEDAMKDGCVERNVIKCLIIGPAGVGKTAIKHLLINKEPPMKCLSTGVMDNPVRAVSLSRAMKNDCDWSVINDDEELMIRIAEHLKADYISGAARKGSKKDSTMLVDNQSSQGQQTLKDDNDCTPPDSLPNTITSIKSKQQRPENLFDGVINKNLEEPEIPYDSSSVSSQKLIIPNDDVELSESAEPILNSGFGDIDNSLPSQMQYNIETGSPHIHEASSSNSIHQKFIDAISNAPGMLIVALKMLLLSYLKTSGYT